MIMPNGAGFMAGEPDNVRGAYTIRLDAFTAWSQIRYRF